MTSALATSMSFEPKDLDEAIRFSELLAKSQLVPVALRKQPSDVLIVLMTGRELGFAPMASLRLLSVIDGKPVIASEAYVAIVRSKPDCEYFRCEETTATQATFVAKRHGHPEQRLTWTLKMAATAQLLGKDNWRKYPETMLRWRAAGALARLEFAHHFAGVYMTDEAEELEKDITPAPDSTPPPRAGVAGLAAAVEAINEGFASTEKVQRPTESTIDAVPPAAEAAPPPAPKPSPPKKEKQPRKPGQYKEANISSLSAEALSAALVEVGNFLKGAASKKQQDAGQALLAELMGEQDARINGPSTPEPANDPPEPGSAG